MAARWADNSVTDCAMVEAGDSAGEGEADGAGEPVGSAAIAVMATSVIIAHEILIKSIVYDCINFRGTHAMPLRLGARVSTLAPRQSLLYSTSIGSSRDWEMSSSRF